MNIPSISILVEILPCEEGNGSVEPAFKVFDFKVLKHSIGESRKVHEKQERIRDNRYDQQILFIFDLYLSINAKSYSER